jgi:hypothetical protein
MRRMQRRMSKCSSCPCASPQKRSCCELGALPKYFLPYMKQVSLLMRVNERSPALIERVLFLPEEHITQIHENQILLDASQFNLEALSEGHADPVRCDPDPG